LIVITGLNLVIYADGQDKPGYDEKGALSVPTRNDGRPDAQSSAIFDANYLRL
jgi:hypothetical protein